MAVKPYVEMLNISKSFGGVKALKNIDFSIYPGEVRALMGENGAGKSTLMKVLSGAIMMDSGEIHIGGKPVTITSPKVSKSYGISTIYQEFILAPHLSVAENIYIDRLSSSKGVVDWKKLKSQTYEILKQMGFDDIDPMTKVEDLSVAYQQVVEICKALSRNAKVLVLDEPTAVLTFKEIKTLFNLIRKLKESGWAIVYISHRLEEVFEICDTVTVLKDGELVGNYQLQEMNKTSLVNLMVGRTMQNYYPSRDVEIGDKVFEVNNVTAGDRVRDISFSVNKGEVLGFYGLVGACRTETMRAIFGADPIDTGEIIINGQRMELKSPARSVSQGIGLLPEDRKNQGVILTQNIRVNTTLSNIKAFSRFGFNRHKKEKELAKRTLAALSTKYGSLEDPASSLSGGNQQKVALAKWLAAKCEVIILDEPTRGVDVGAKREIYAIINQLAEEGSAIIVISSEMEEIMNISDRIIVMRNGRIEGEVKKEEITEQRLIHLAMGVSDNE